MLWGTSCRCMGFIFGEVHRLSLVAANGAHLWLWCRGLSRRWLLPLWGTSSRCVGFSTCSTQARQLRLVGPRASAQQLPRMGSVPLWHVGSSRIRDRRILHHWLTRKSQKDRLSLHLPPPCGSLGLGTGLSEPVNLTRQAAWRFTEHPASESDCPGSQAASTTLISSV